MIHDTLKNARHYGNLHEGIRKGLDFLHTFDPAIPDGRVEIDGDDVFALVQTYRTTAADEKQFEAHRIHADIQYLSSGQETIVCAPLERLTAVTEYDPEKDFVLFSDAPDPINLTLRPGDFAIFLPEDGHKPGCHREVSCDVRKVVVKVKL